LLNGVLGLNAELFDDYLRYLADRRLERIGIEKQYNTNNRFLWMSETIDLAKEKNLFETRVKEYQSAGSLEW
jgi:ribonucleoside-diphosphate reductase beta chain